MQISLKWINELVKVDKINLDDLIEKLTFGGFEVEEILELEIENEKQIALDISATANRSDSLSIQGISIEIAALLNQSIHLSKYSIECGNFKERILKKARLLSNEENCSLLFSIMVTNLTDHTVPPWMKDKLIGSGIKPLNNLLDFQNYIFLETGYFFAFYDLDKIQSKLENASFQLSISKAQKNQEFLAGNGNTYQLDDSILLVQANQIPLSIAGIIENKDFSYSEKTTSILIEGSIFNPAKIRQQSRNLGLRTDRSTRYEKSLKKTYLIESFYRFISLLRIGNPTLKCEVNTILKTMEESPKPILLRYERIAEILGPIQELSCSNFEYISPNTIENYLRRLKFSFIYDEIKQVWTVSIPDCRTDDLTREIDLIEEIGRLHGFNNFLISLPKLKRIGSQDISYQTRKKITSCLLNLGFNELIHYSLVNEKTCVENKIQLINPLVSEYSRLRISLLPSIIRTIQENLKQGNSIINGFEYGHVFFKDLKNNFQEKEHLAGIFGGFTNKLSWSDSEKVFSWFEAKGRIQQLFSQLKISTVWKMASVDDVNPIFHNYRTANIYLMNGIKLGVFGQIHPLLANELNLPLELYLFELNLEVIQDQRQLNQLPIYQEYSSYPKIIRDLSFLIQEDIHVAEIEKILYANGSKFLSEISLLDEYKGPGIPEGHISLCFQFIFQSSEKTLQNKEIEEIITNLRSLLMTKFNVKIRN